MSDLAFNFNRHEVYGIRGYGIKLNALSVKSQRGERRKFSNSSTAIFIQTKLGGNSEMMIMNSLPMLLKSIRVLRHFTENLSFNEKEQSVNIEKDL
ncbi:hypothetical protein TNCV_4549481 [Trichonephila clavipes]|nr:hypothetical protein TNCV_4549481 [Trichonephila clavipes]